MSHRAPLVLLTVRAVASTADFATAGGSVLAQLPVILAAAAMPLAGLASWRFYSYSQLEYITAAMLSRHVPRDGSGARIIQIGGGTKELFYYPKSALQVTVVGEGINKGLLEQAGLQASVPTAARVQSPASLSFAASSSVDAVVALQSISSMGPMAVESFLAEAVRVLKPGCPLIFVEKDQTVLFAYLESKQHQWDQVEYDVALEGQDPHVVGVALKSKTYVGTAPRRIDIEDLASKVLAKRESVSRAKDLARGLR